MSFEFGGIQAHAIDLQELRGAIRAGGAPETSEFLRYYPAEMWSPAMTELQHNLDAGGVLSELAACALLQLVAAHGTDAGFISSPIEQSAEYPRFARTWYPRLFSDPDLAERALSGGLLDLRGSGRFGFGGLTPPEWQTAAQQARALAADEYEQLAREGGWSSSWAEALLDIVASADGTRALVLAPHYVELMADQETYEGATRPPELDGPHEPETPQILSVLRAAVERKASDIVAAAHVPVMLRISGRLEALGDTPLTPEQVMRFMRPVMTDSQVDELEREGTLFSFGVKDLGRFRVAMVRERGAPLSNVRVIPVDPPPFKKLGFPSTLLARRAGLVLVGGRAGSGRTSAVASIVRALLEKQPRFVLTLEEPIEVSHPRGKGVVAQIDIGHDVPTFDKAMQLARASSADVIVLDHVDTSARLAAARELAAAGRLVLATVSGRPRIQGATVLLPRRAR